MMKNSMFKAFLLVLALIVLRGNSIANDNKPDEKNPASAVILKIGQASDATIFLKSFFKWYKTKYEYLNHQIFPVDMDFRSNKPYRINFKETEKYLAVLKSSGFFSDEYITNNRTYFKAVDEKLKKTKQNDGTVDGLDYDPIVHHQEPESILENLDGLKFSVTKSTTNYVSVKMTTIFDQNTYSLYTLKRSGNRFFIDKINFIIERVE